MSNYAVTFVLTSRFDTRAFGHTLVFVLRVFLGVLFLLRWLPSVGPSNQRPVIAVSNEMRDTKWDEKSSCTAAGISIVCSSSAKRI